jgi:C-terminal processing protease CtpA/Prc
MRGGGAALLAAALQDNRRAAIVGEPTKIDPFEHSLVELPDHQGGLWLPTGRIERATARDGGPAPLTVRPDHAIPFDQKQRQRWFEWRHDQQMEKVGGDKAPVDPQLDKAIEVLRAAIMKSDRAVPLR